MARRPERTNLEDVTITPTTEFPETAASLDTLLASVARKPQDSIPGKALGSWALSLALHPRRATRRVAGAAVELGKIAAGISTIAPEKRDARFADPGWKGNPALRRALQAYLLFSERALQMLDDADLSERNDQRARLLVANLIDALAPSNNPVLNPAALKATIDHGGLNLARGAKAFAKDMARAPRVPATNDPHAFRVGRDLALTPGAVVLRTPMFELIQYTPATKKVREFPIVIAPPTVNKYYVLDLAPGRSQIEYLVAQGFQVFAISWRNPSPRHAGWGTDAYIQSIIEAFSAAREITQAPQAVLYGVCSGGILASMAAAYLFGTGRGSEVAAFQLSVTVLDQTRGGTINSLLDPAMAATAIAASKRKGYMDGASLAEVFAWMRPNEVVWNYWVNNYLLGKKPPAFDILAWNSDVVRMPAKLHENLMNMSIENSLVEAGKAEALGVPVDLSQITCDAYVLSGENDHITPWQGGYQSVRLLGGKVDYILSRSGHIAAMVNPPTNAKATFRHGVNPTGSAADFRASAELIQGSWWPHWSEWLSARTGELVNAPAELGRGSFTPIVTAPGTYVFDK